MLELLRYFFLFLFFSIIGFPLTFTVFCTSFVLFFCFDFYKHMCGDVKIERAVEAYEPPKQGNFFTRFFGCSSDVKNTPQQRLRQFYKELDVENAKTQKTNAQIKETQQAIENYERTRRKQIETEQQHYTGDNTNMQQLSICYPQNPQFQTSPILSICPPHIETFMEKDEQQQQIDRKFKTLPENQLQVSTIFNRPAFELPKLSTQPAQNHYAPSHCQTSLNEIKTTHPNKYRKIGVIGLKQSGKSFIIRALTKATSAKAPLSNPAFISHCEIHEFSYPNNGFIDGSINENKPAFEKFIQNSQLFNFSTLIITSYGSFREEDFLMMCLAKEFGIPFVLVRTKLDEWLDNLPEGQTKEEHVFTDKKYMNQTLQKLGFQLPFPQIYHISGIAMIKMAKDGFVPNMMQYQQDEQELIEAIKINEPISEPLQTRID